MSESDENKPELPPGFDVFAWAWAAMNADERAKLRFDGKTPKHVKEYIEIVENFTKSAETTIQLLNNVFFETMQRRSVVQLTLDSVKIPYDVTRHRPVCTKCNGRAKWERSGGYQNSEIHAETCGRCNATGREKEMDTHVLLRLDDTAYVLVYGPDDFLKSVEFKGHPK